MVAGTRKAALAMGGGTRVIALPYDRPRDVFAQYG